MTNTVTASHVLGLEIKSLPYVVFRNDIELALKELLRTWLPKLPDLLNPGKSTVAPDVFWLEAEELKEGGSLQTFLNKYLGKKQAPTTYWRYKFASTIFPDNKAANDALKFLAAKLSGEIDELIGPLRFSLNTGEKLRPISWESLEKRYSAGLYKGWLRSADKDPSRFGFYRKPETPTAMGAIVLPTWLPLFLADKDAAIAWVCKFDEGPGSIKFKPPKIEPANVRLVEIPHASLVAASGGFGNLSAMRTDRLEESEYLWGGVPNKKKQHIEEENQPIPTTQYPAILKNIGCSLGLSLDFFVPDLQDEMETLSLSSKGTLLLPSDLSSPANILAPAPRRLKQGGYASEQGDSLSGLTYSRTQYVRFGDYGKIAYFKRFCYNQRKCDPKTLEPTPRVAPAYASASDVKAMLRLQNFDLSEADSKKQKGQRTAGVREGVTLTAQKGHRKALFGVMAADATTTAKELLNGDKTYWTAYNNWAKSGGHTALVRPPSTPNEKYQIRTEQEWCHLVGWAHGGPDEANNLVAGSKHCNSEQLALEHAIRVSNESGIDIKIKVTAYGPDLTQLSHLHPGVCSFYARRFLVRNLSKENVDVIFLRKLVPLWRELNRSIDKKTILELFSCGSLRGRVEKAATDFIEILSKSLGVRSEGVDAYLRLGNKDAKAESLSNENRGVDQEILVKAKMSTAFEQIRQAFLDVGCIAAVFIRYVIMVDGRKAFDHIIDAQREAFNPHEYSLLHWGARFSIAKGHSPIIKTSKTNDLLTDLFSKAVRGGDLNAHVFAEAGLETPAEFVQSA